MKNIAKDITNRSFNRGARWALKYVENKLPLSGNGCDCSADIVYYILEAKKILEDSK